MLRNFLFSSKDGVWFTEEDNTSFSYLDRWGTLIESPYEEFEKGDTVTVKYRGEEKEDRGFEKIGDEIFVRGKAVYSTKDFCPFHEVRKMKDDKNNETYCPVCES